MIESEAYSAKAARAGKDIGKKGKNFDKIAKKAAERYGSEERGKKVAGAILKKLRMKEEAEQLGEKAPPGKKFERMVKHIKKGYESGGLTKQEKGIAYATAWKSYNKEEVEPVNEVKVGDKVHVGMNQKGGSGFKGTVHKIDGENVHVNVGTTKYGDRIVKGQMKNVTKEEVEQIDELKTGTLLRYATKATKSLTGGDRSKENKRIKGIQLAKHKIQQKPKMKEEVEQVSELSTELLARYKTAAVDSYREADKRGDLAKTRKRFKGTITATNKQFANDLKKHASKQNEGKEASKLPPHLQKLIKDKNLDKVFMKTVPPKHTVKDVTPKGYGPTEEVELDEAIPKSTSIALVHTASKKIVAKGDKNQMMKKMKELNSKEKGSHHLGVTYRGKVGDTFGEEVEQVDEVIGNTTGYSDSGPRNKADERKFHQMRNVVTKGPRTGKITKHAQNRLKDRLKTKTYMEEVEQVAEKFSDAQIAALRTAYSKISGIDPESHSYQKLLTMLDDMDKATLTKVANGNIKFVSGLARNRLKRMDEDTSMSIKFTEFRSRLDEATGVTDYNPKSQGGTRKELLAKYAKTKDPKHAEAARRSGATQGELKAARMEEVEQIDEAPYMGKGNHKPGWMLRADPELARKFKEIEDRKKRMNSMMKKYGGKTGDEIDKMKKEEVEQVDELKQSTLGSYIKKASHDVATKSALTRHFATKSRDEKEKQNYTQARKDDETSNKLFNKSWKRRQGIAKAVDRLTKKEVEIS